MNTLLQELLDYGTPPGQAIVELRRHGAEAGLQALAKNQWKAADVVNALGKFGWKFGREGGSHAIYVHPGIPGRPVAIKREHMRGNLDPFWTKKYFADAGLKWNPHDDSVRPHPGHAYAPHYAAMGMS